MKAFEAHMNAHLCAPVKWGVPFLSIQNHHTHWRAFICPPSHNVGIAMPPCLHPTSQTFNSINGNSSEHAECQNDIHRQHSLNEITVLRSRRNHSWYAALFV